MRVLSISSVFEQLAMWEDAHIVRSSFTCAVHGSTSEVAGEGSIACTLSGGLCITEACLRMISFPRAKSVIQNSASELFFSVGLRRFLKAAKRVVNMSFWSGHMAFIQIASLQM